MKIWIQTLLWALTVTVLLAGCAAEEDEGEETRELESSGGGSCSGSYPDIITASEREAANACGTQVSVQFVAADGYLETALSLCSEGSTSGADEYYDNYESQVDYARSVAEGYDCEPGSSGGGGVTIEDPTEAEYYRLCTAQTSDYIYASCQGPVQYSDTACNPIEGNAASYVTRYNSLNECITARDDYLNDA
ncbi:hypothetical protein [Marinimicrobium agarilyticum]|uniref:hypothetical protein n=1 Tax=Marinimicrobium agarilyticum TaxID=306546 RepID=UPI00040E7F65|nr:hypothetical protein [Marinimicrobium agarilyticum]